MEGNRRRSARIAAAAGAAALALSVAACGGESSSDSDEPAGAYEVEVTTAKFPTRQRLGETTLLRLGVRNTGDKALPALTTTFELEKEEGESSSIPFAIRSSEPGLAQPDRPVWVLSARYPKLAGEAIGAGAETASKKTYDFGPLQPGEAARAVWKLSAVRTGKYTLVYEIGAGLGGKARAESAAGVEPGGSFTVRITEVPPETIVTDSGEVVEAPRPREQTRANR